MSHRSKYGNNVSWLARITGAGLDSGLDVAFSAGGDGGRKSPELPAQSAHAVCGSDCRTIAVSPNAIAMLGGRRGLEKLEAANLGPPGPHSVAKLPRKKFEQIEKHGIFPYRTRPNPRRYKSLNMTETGDDPVASWNERIGSLRKRGRISAASLAVVPAEEIDARRGRPPAPERLSASERGLWEKLTFSRRPNWFSGAEELLASYVVMLVQVQQLEVALRKVRPGASERYQKLTKTHQQLVSLAARLATRLRLTPHSKVDKNQPTDGELPVG